MIPNPQTRSNTIIEAVTAEIEDMAVALDRLSHLRSVNISVKFNQQTRRVRTVIVTMESEKGSGG